MPYSATWKPPPGGSRGSILATRNPRCGAFAGMDQSLVSLCGIMLSRPVKLRCANMEIPTNMKLAVNSLFLLVSLWAISADAQTASFQHIVVIVQENRTPDNLFQGLCGPNRALCPSPYNLQSFGTDNEGNQVPLVPVSLGSAYDPDHSH